MPTPLSFAAQPSGGWSHPGGSAAGSAARAGPSKARPGLLEPGKVGAGRCARATPAEPRLRRKIVVATDKFLIPDRFLPGKLFCSLALLLARSLACSLVRSLPPSLLPGPGGGRAELMLSSHQSHAAAATVRAAAEPRPGSFIGNAALRGPGSDSGSGAAPGPGPAISPAAAPAGWR